MWPCCHICGGCVNFTLNSISSGCNLKWRKVDPDPRKCSRWSTRSLTGSRASSGKRKWSWPSSACSTLERPHSSMLSLWVHLEFGSCCFFTHVKLCAVASNFIVCTFFVAVRSVQRGHDPNSRLQHEEGHEGQCHDQNLGHRRSTSLQVHVGALLSRRQCHRVCSLSPVNQFMKLAEELSSNRSGADWFDLISIFFSCSYMVDAADQDKLEASRNELHNLLDKPQLAGIPVLVLGNKKDLPNALDEKGLIERM